MEENEWQMKCGLNAQCSSSPLEQIQLQEDRNKINMNISHCILPRDGQGSLPPHLKQAPSSSMLNFGSCKQIHPENGSSFLPVPPSLSQHDFQQQLNAHCAHGGCPPDISSQGKVGTVSRSSLQNSANFNARAGEDALPNFPSRCSMDMNSGTSRGVINDLDALRAFITSGCPKNEIGINTSLQKGITCAPSSGTVLTASMQTPSSVSGKQNSAVNEYPRVFCLSACGELLLSNTGLFGILCACHGMRMSVSKFCEHSGLSDVNPGYAVRIDSGESIAQWRKEYLQKFGIRAPGDHRGWDWSEGLLATSGLANSSRAVADKRKVFDLSSLFNSSAQPVKATQPWNNLSSSRPQSSQEYSNQTLTNAQRDGHDHFGTDGSRRISNAITDYPRIACPTSRTLAPSLAIGKEGSGGDCRSKSFHCISSHENSYSSAFQKLPSFSSKAHNINKDCMLDRGKISSSTELKLGQPSQLSWGSGSAALSTVRPHSTGVQTTTFQEKLIHNLANANVTGHNKQHIFCDSVSDFSRKVELFQASPLNKRSISLQGHLNNALTSFQAGPLNNPSTSFRAGPLNNIQNSANGSAHGEFVKDGFHNSLEISTPSPPTNNFAGGSSYNKEINKRIPNIHPFSPLTLQNQPRVDRSLLNNGDSPTRPIDVDKLVLSNNKGRIMDATLGHKETNFGCSTGYTKKMESHGFTRNGICNPNTSASPTPNFSPLGMANMLSSVSGASDFVGNAGNLASSSIGFTPLSAVVAPGYGPASFSKHVEALNLHTSEESLRHLSSWNVEKSSKEKPIDASLVYNHPPLIHSDERQHNSNNSDLRAHKLFLDQGNLEGQRRPFSVGHIASTTVLPDAGQKGMNLGAITEEILPELTEKYNDDPCSPQPKQQSPLSVGRRESIGCECNMVQRFFGGPSFHLSDRCKNNVQTICSKEHDCDGSSSIYGSKKQVKNGVVESPKHSSLKFAEKETFLASSQKGKNQAFKLDCMNSQWIDAPPKANSVSRMRCSDVSPLLLDARAESVVNLKELSAKGTPRLNQATESLKEKEFSDISSDCSVTAVTQASNEVNIIDQGSAISRSCSSVEAIDSVRNSQIVCNGKTISAEEESLMSLSNIARHGMINESKQTHSKSNELRSVTVSGGNSAEIFIKDQNENEFKPRKRKRTTKWKMLGASFSIAEVSQLPFESRVCAGSMSNHHASISEEDHVLLQPNLNSSKMRTVNSSYDSLKQCRSTKFSVKMLSCDRDLDGMYNSEDRECGDHRSLKDNDDFSDMPQSPGIKKLKKVWRDEIVKKQTKATEAAKGSWTHNQSATFQKLKPVACGKYGIICDQELDIDSIKPPKIVPLSQVLKACKRHTKSEKARVVPSKRKKYNVHRVGGRKFLDLSSNFHQAQGSLYNKVQSGHLRALNDSTKETRQIDLDNTHIDDLSVAEDVGLCEGERVSSVLACKTANLSKTKETRMRSLYELSMKGNKFISADINRSQNVMCAQSKVSGLATATPDTGRRDGGESRSSGRRSCRKQNSFSMMSKMDELCCVCGISNKDNANCLLECGNCLIRIHQACYGISRTPKGDWYCRPCKTSSKDVVCVLCGYGGGAMTRAFGCRYVVKSLLKAWDIRTEPHIMSMGSAEALYVPAKMKCQNDLKSATYQLCPSVKPVVHNSIISGLFDPTVKQWIHMVCGLWTPGTRCPNVDTMSAFDVSGVSHPREHMVCYICNRDGGSCIKCRVETCSTHFHPWCAHQKGLLQSEVEGVDNDALGFYGRCLLHVDSKACENDDIDKPDSETEGEDEPSCARTKGYQGKKNGLKGQYSSYQRSGKNGHLVSQVQLDAWNYINTHKLSMNSQLKPPVSDVDQDYRKEYARYKQTKGWKHLVVYKSGIHALGLYTSQIIQRGAMVVEYIGEIVGPRVADKRESEYLSGRKLQYKSACYFFRIDKEQIIDATRKGGIARFVNHSCQPNCVAKVLTIRGEKKVVFFAQRDINPGEEITYDYHFNHEDEGKKIPCFCNSKNCRRYLN